MQSTHRPIALVTGASSGIGEAIARELAARGHDLLLAARRVDRLEALGSELRAAHPGLTCRVALADLGAPGVARALADEALANGGRIDVLVNNAGFGLSSAFAAADQERTDELIRVNIGALTTLTRALLPPMIARRSGGVLNVASVAAFVPGPLMATYYASKAYVESFSVALRRECLEHGVRVSCLCPGATATEFSAVARAGRTKLFRHAPAMSAAAVARAGVDGLARNRAIVIPGVRNTLVAVGGKLLPRVVAAIAAERMNRTT